MDEVWIKESSTLELKIYDSLNSNYNKNIVNQLSTILKNYKTQIDKFLIHNIQVNRQPSVHDCGWYAKLKTLKQNFQFWNFKL